MLRFKASVVITEEGNSNQAMLIMTPDAKNLDELRDMNLTLSDLPVHDAHRDAVFLREHLSTQMNNALKMEKLTRSLETEKKLLESMLPFHAANGLREGKKVEPRMHDNVTMFFSDIVGFTNICKNIYPHDVIVLLNRLYCVMDYLANKFGLFKIETIGDAYVCCSGLPDDNDNHAVNVANFAIAVSHCSRLVASPIGTRKEPIELRIGIHSGPCASGIVGTVNPRYCVFGDTVNTAARHEQTGSPGRIHCSNATKGLLFAPGAANGSMYKIEERGLVEMKGKGSQTTYWLSASEDNQLVNSKALHELDEEVSQLLQSTNFDNVKTSYKDDMSSDVSIESRVAELLEVSPYIDKTKKGFHAATDPSSSSSRAIAAPMAKAKKKRNLSFRPIRHFGVEQIEF